MPISDNIDYYIFIRYNAISFFADLLLVLVATAPIRSDSSATQLSSAKCNETGQPCQTVKLH